MKEKIISDERSFVGVDMGDGCECPNEPRLALKYLVQNCDTLAIRLHRSTGPIVPDERRGIERNKPANRTYLRNAIDKHEIIELAEQFETAQLELAWMFGRQSIVNELTKGETKNG